MTEGFLGSREFNVATAIVLVVALTTGVAAVALPDGFFSTGSRGCTVEDLPGTSIGRSVPGGVEQHGDVIQRVLRNTADVTGLQGGSVHACTRVGDVDVVVSEAQRVHVTATFRIAATDDQTERSVALIEFDVRLLQYGDVVNVVVQHGSLPRTGSWFDDRSGYLDLRLELPTNMTWALALDTQVGNIELGKVTSSTVDVRTEVGDIRLHQPAVEGRLSLHTDVGHITGRLDNVASGLHAQTDVGDIDLQIDRLGTGSHGYVTDVGTIELRLPVDNDTGYDTIVRTGVGARTVELGPMEATSGADGRSVPLRMRTVDFDQKETQVQIVATADVGAVVLRAVDGR